MMSHSLFARYYFLPQRKFISELNLANSILISPGWKIKYGRETKNGWQPRIGLTRFVIFQVKIRNQFVARYSSGFGQPNLFLRKSVAPLNSFSRAYWNLSTYSQPVPNGRGLKTLHWSQSWNCSGINLLEKINHLGTLFFPRLSLTPDINPVNLCRLRLFYRTQEKYAFVCATLVLTSFFCPPLPSFDLKYLNFTFLELTNSGEFPLHLFSHHLQSLSHFESKINKLAHLWILPTIFRFVIPFGKGFHLFYCKSLYV